MLANASPDTIARWTRRWGIGRQLAPRSPWRISLPALRMVLAADVAALEAFRAGDVTSPKVSIYLPRVVA